MEQGEPSEEERQAKLRECTRRLEHAALDGATPGRQETAVTGLCRMFGESFVRAAADTLGHPVRGVVSRVLDQT